MNLSQNYLVFMRFIVVPIALLIAVSGIQAQNLGVDVTCSNCNLTAASKAAAFPLTPILATPTFSTGCVGAVKQSKDGSAAGERQTYEAFLSSVDVNACPLFVEVDGQKSNILHAVNGPLIYVGQATGGLALLADNGSINVSGGGDDSLVVQADNGSITSNGMGGNLSFSAVNGSVTLNNTYGHELIVLSKNGSINVSKLSLYPKNTANFKAENGSIVISKLSGVVLNKTNTKYMPVKVRVITRVTNGRVRDRRPIAQRTLSRAERKNAAVLRIEVVNGDVLLR